MATGYLRHSETGELLIEDGGFVVGETDNQEMEIIAMAETGDIKNSLLLGAGFKRLPNANVDAITRAVGNLKFQLSSDGFKNVSVEYDGSTGDVSIDGNQ